MGNVVSGYKIVNDWHEQLAFQSFGVWVISDFAGGEHVPPVPLGCFFIINHSGIRSSQIDCKMSCWCWQALCQIVHIFPLNIHTVIYHCRKTCNVNNFWSENQLCWAKHFDKENKISTQYYDRNLT